MALEIVTTSSRPDLDDAAAAAFRERWPEFVFHDPVPPAYLPRVGQYFAEHDLLVLLDGEVVAGGWAVPFAWDGSDDTLPEGYDAAMVQAVDDHEAGRPATTLGVMATAVGSGREGQGLAVTVLEGLAARADAAGLDHVVAPVRPTRKHRYPTTPIAEYASWTRPDGLSIDPWIRLHQRMGARVVGPAPSSMVVPGTVAEWEGWADMALPVSGDYVVPGGLDLLRVDREGDRAVYRETNLWMQHR